MWMCHKHVKSLVWSFNGKLVTAQQESEERWGEFVALGFYLDGGCWHKKKKKSHLFTVESAPDTQAHAPQDFFQLNGWSQLGGNKGGRGRKREEETPAEGVWQSSDGGMGRERGALNLLEEEVWRKGLGKTERGVSLTWPPCLCLPQPIQALFTHTHMHSSPPLSWRSPWVWAKKPPGCQGLPEKALTDVMIQSAQIFPLSFSRSGSEETDRANIRGGKKHKTLSSRLSGQLIAESLNLLSKESWWRSDALNSP